MTDKQSSPIKDDNIKDELTKTSLMEDYSDYILSKGERPKNVYSFSKALNFPENKFYNFFSGFDTLEEEYLVYFFEKSQELVNKTEDYEQLDAKEQLLNFYYIFFENLNMNRSLVLMILKDDLKSKFKKLKRLKKKHHDFIKDLDIDNSKLADKLPKSLKEHSDKPKEETLWLHFMSILKFWTEDQSVGFEKTDIYIEKSINTGFELFENSIIDKVADLSKFLWRENFE